MNDIYHVATAGLMLVRKGIATIELNYRNSDDLGYFNIPIGCIHEYRPEQISYGMEIQRCEQTEKLLKFAGLLD